MQIKLKDADQQIFEGTTCMKKCVAEVCVVENQKIYLGGCLNISIDVCICS